MATGASALWQGALRDAAALRPFQDNLNDMASAAERKAEIINAVCMGLISREDCQLLFDVYDLATA